jgi:hypothetical protein
MKRLYIIFILFLVIINIQCNSGGNAIVTINVGTTPKISYLDHFLQLLTFAKKANAAVSTNVASISYKVEASDIETITGAIPLETGSVTIELTPGNNRTFTIYAYDSNNFKIYACKTTVDLQPGNNTVDIVMEKTMFTIDSSSNITGIDLAIGNGIPYIAYIKSSQINIKYLSETLQTIDTTSLNYPADSLDLEYYNTLYIASHFQNVNYYINVSKFNGSSWGPLLDNGDDISNVDNNPNTFSLKINSAGPYFAYIINDYYPAVKIYSEGATPKWDPVGSLSTPQGGDISMAYDSANNIYIAYTTSMPTAIEVKKYSGSSWSNFPNTSTPPTYNPMEVSIAIDGNDVVYVAHRNNINPSRVAVVKCPQNGTEWTPAAGSDMYVSGTIKAAQDIQMAFDGNNRLYVVYYDFNSDYSNYQLHIKRVNGSNWEEVDVINLPAKHYVFSPKIAIRGDVCYIAYVDCYDSQRDVILYKIML